MDAAPVIAPEEWRDVLGFEPYQASSRGRIRGPLGVLSPTLTTGGYLQVGTHIGAKKLTLRVNRAVAIAFHGAPPTPDHQAAHNNGDRLDNRPGNLRWATPVENAADRIQHGTHMAGPTHPCAKLRAEAVVAIRAEFQAHMASRRAAGFVRPRRGLYPDLAAEHGTTTATVKDILQGRTWHPLYLPEDLRPTPWNPMENVNDDR